MQARSQSHKLIIRCVGECENVSPWEIERDPEDTYQIQADKAARAAEIAAKLAPQLPPPVPTSFPAASSFLFQPGLPAAAPPLPRHAPHHDALLLLAI